MFTSISRPYPPVIYSMLRPSCYPLNINKDIDTAYSKRKLKINSRDYLNEYCLFKPNLCRPQIPPVCVGIHNTSHLSIPNVNGRQLAISSKHVSYIVFNWDLQKIRKSSSREFVSKHNTSSYFLS